MVGTAKNMLLPERLSSVTAYGALLVLALLQLGIALHHDEHSATDLTSACAACVQLEQFDDVPATDATGIVINAGFALAALPLATVAVSEPSLRYHSRAPPAHA